MAVVKGMYLRGEIWWLRYTVNGKQVRTSLNFPDEGHAAIEALKYLQDAPLKAVDIWEGEVEAFLQDRLAKNRYSRASVLSKRCVLMRFAHDMEVSSPANVKAGEVERWFERIRGEGGRAIQKHKKVEPK